MRDHDAAQSTARCHPGLHVNIPIAPAPGVNGLAPRLSIAYGGGRGRKGQRADRESNSDLVTVVAVVAQ